MTIIAEVEQIVDGLSDQEKAIFDTVVNIACKVDPSFQNRIQWKVPTFTLNDNWHHWIFSLAKTKKGMTVTFHKGWLLDDPEEALLGEGPHLRMLRFLTPGEIKKKILADLIRSAIQHQLDM